MADVFLGIAHCIFFNCELIHVESLLPSDPEVPLGKRTCYLPSAGMSGPRAGCFSGAGPALGGSFGGGSFAADAAAFGGGALPGHAPGLT